MTRSNPRTNAGRALADKELWHVGGGDTGVGIDVADILAIEDEAAATERRLTVERVREALPSAVSEDDDLLYWTSVLSILDDLATADVDEEEQP